MRIVEDTPSQLVLRDRTLWISCVCLAGAAAMLVRFLTAGDEGLLIGAAVMSAFAIPFLRATDLVFDKGQRMCSLRRLDMGRIKRLSLPFSEIRDIRVEVEPMAGDSQVISCRFSLVTAAEVIPLTAAYEPDLERFNRMREIILAMLFSPAHRPEATDPVLDLVTRGQIVAAVALLRKRDGLDLTTAKARVDAMRKALTD
jgi:hypothetical protein